MRHLMLIIHFMTVNPQTNQIWIKLKQWTKNGGSYRRIYAEWNTRERNFQEL